MPKFKVRFQPSADLAVTVEAEDYDDAIDKAYDERPTGICAQCSGWRQPFSLDVVTDDGIEPYEVVDETGERVWSQPSYIDGLHDTIKSLREQISNLKTNTLTGG